MCKCLIYIITSLIKFNSVKYWMFHAKNCILRFDEEVDTCVLRQVLIVCLIFKIQVQVFKHRFLYLVIWNPCVVWLRNINWLKVRSLWLKNDFDVLFLWIVCVKFLCGIDMSLWLKLVLKVWLLDFLFFLVQNCNFVII